MINMRYRTFCRAVPIWMLFFLFVMNGLPIRPAAAERVAISGAFALYPMTVRWAQEYGKRNSGAVFDISTGGAGKGMSDVLSGAVNIGMVSREIRPEERRVGIQAFAVAKDAVVPVVNAGNPLLPLLLKRGLTGNDFRRIWIEEGVTTWGRLLGTAGAQPLKAYTRSDTSGAAESWAGYLGGRQDDLKGTGVYGDPGILEAVRKDSGGIGYNNIAFVYDPATGRPVKGAVVPPIDLDQNGRADPGEMLDTRRKILQAVETGAYPHPPARPLYLVTMGKPVGEVRDFIRWVLAEGQAFVGETGYVNLPPDVMEGERRKLD